MRCEFKWIKIRADREGRQRLHDSSLFLRQQREAQMWELAKALERLVVVAGITSSHWREEGVSGKFGWSHELSLRGRRDRGRKHYWRYRD